MLDLNRWFLVLIFMLFSTVSLFWTIETTVGSQYHYDVTNFGYDDQKYTYDYVSNLHYCCFGQSAKSLDEKPQAEAFFASLTDFNVTKGATELSKSAQKGIRSLENRIAEHEKKLADFKANPTVRPGMEGQPESVIKAAQESRIRHLEKEIQTFKENIEKLKGGQ